MVASSASPSAAVFWTWVSGIVRLWGVSSGALWLSSVCECFHQLQHGTHHYHFGLCSVGAPNRPSTDQNVTSAHLIKVKCEQLTEIKTAFLNVLFTEFHIFTDWKMKGF